jgi:poly(3-hydroxybutyrate) depolymerase
MSLLRCLATMIGLSLLLVPIAEARKKDETAPPTVVRFSHAGQERSYYLYAPAGLAAGGPLVLLLHGSGRDGSTLVEPWRELADEHGLVLVGPDSARSEEWSPYADNPAFFQAVLADVATRHSFDPARVVLFGHSGGAVWALQVGLLDSERYAAVAVHAGLIPDESLALTAQARRKIPYQIQIGDRDPFFPVAAVRRTVETLTAAGFAVDLVEIKRHDHDYYRLAEKVNLTAWTFLANAIATPAGEQ